MKYNKQTQVNIQSAPLLIAPSEKIEGLLTLEKANKYKIGLFETIDFKTYCALNNKSSNYNINYVVLVKTGKWLFPYLEPFTSQNITEVSNRIVRGKSNYIDLLYTGNETNLHELSISKLSQIFPNEKALEEYKSLLTSFAEENKSAFYEIKKIQEAQAQQKRKINYELSSYNIPDKSIGKSIFEKLSIHNKKSNEIYQSLMSSSDEKAAQIKVLEYTIKDR